MLKKTILSLFLLTAAVPSYAIYDANNQDATNGSDLWEIGLRSNRKLVITQDAIDVIFDHRFDPGKGYDAGTRNAKLFLREVIYSTRDRFEGFDKSAKTLAFIRAVNAALMEQQEIVLDITNAGFHMSVPLNKETVKEAASIFFSALTSRLQVTPTNENESSISIMEEDIDSYASNAVYTSEPGSLDENINNYLETTFDSYRKEQVNSLMQVIKDTLDIANENIQKKMAETFAGMKEDGLPMPLSIYKKDYYIRVDEEKLASLFGTTI